jgi:hypothetical protein
MAHQKRELRKIYFAIFKVLCLFEGVECLGGPATARFWIRAV